MLMKLLLKNNSTRPRDSCACNMRRVRRVQQLTSRIGQTVRQPMRHRSAVGQPSSLSSRTKWQRLPVGDTVCRVLAASSRCHFALLIMIKVVQQLTCHIGCLVVRPIRPVSCRTCPRCDKHTHDPASDLHSH